MTLGKVLLSLLIVHKPSPVIYNALKHDGEVLLSIYTSGIYTMNGSGQDSVGM